LRERTSLSKKARLLRKASIISCGIATLMAVYAYKMTHKTEHILALVLWSALLLMILLFVKV